MGVTSLKGVTGLGPATNSFTSAGPRTVVNGFIRASCYISGVFAPPFCQHFEYLLVHLDVVPESMGCVARGPKTDKLRISTQFHVAFAPNLSMWFLYLLLCRKATANFPSIINGLWSTDIFSRLAAEMPN